MSDRTDTDVGDRGSASALPVLVARVREAALWTERHFRADDPVGSLRRLRGPTSSNVPANSRSDVPIVLQQRTDAIADLGLARDADWASAPLPAGRILSLMPDESLSDGAVEEVTGGFFDAHNVAAWDTWIALVSLTAKTAGTDDPWPVGHEGVHLLTWVPRTLASRVDRAIWVNPEQCLRWLDDVDPEFADLLMGRPPQRAPGLRARIERSLRPG